MILLRDFFNDSYRPLRLLGKSKRTVDLYEYTIRIFSQSLGRPATVDDLNDITVANHLQRLLDQDRSPHGVNKERAQLVALWNFAAKQRLLEKFPNVPRITAPMVVPKAWTQSQLEKLFDACASKRGNVGSSSAADWWYAIHCVLWDSGERIGAVLQVTWDDLEGDWLTFKAGYRKGKRKEQIVKLHPSTIEAIDKLDRFSSVIFPWDKSETYLYRVYNDILERAGLPTDSKSKFHRMRRSFASHLHAMGEDATAACGHSSDRITRESYIDPRIAAKKQPSDLLFRAG